MKCLLALYLLLCAGNATAQEKIFPPESLLIVKADSIFYSKVFVEGLNALANNGKEKIFLFDGYLVYGKDTISFPDNLKLHKSYEFISKDDSLHYSLSVKRINYSTLEYMASITTFDNSVYAKGGIANLNPSFFLGVETLQDGDGDAHGAMEYLDDNGLCNMYINITLSADATMLKAAWNKSCKQSNSISGDLKSGWSPLLDVQ